MCDSASFSYTMSVVKLVQHNEAEIHLQVSVSCWDTALWGPLYYYFTLYKLKMTVQRACVVCCDLFCIRIPAYLS